MDPASFSPAIDAVRRAFGAAQPRCALVLGSGWGAVAETWPVARQIAYAEIPGLGAPSVPGHAGRLLLADAGRLSLLVFQGRRHWYEGAGWAPVALPIRIAAAFGVRTLILTNAAGAVRPDWQPGDLMLIGDHINAMGANPLIGPHDPAWGPRFPDQTRVYDPALGSVLEAAAAACGIALRRGIYLAAAGPAYETPAEVAAFRALGADAIGVSTVPEAMLAHAAGLRVAALACLTNLAAGVAAGPLSHQDVLETTRRVQPRLSALLAAFFERLPAAPAP